MCEDAREDAARFGEVFNLLDRTYARYARSVGLNYTSLYVLYIIATSESCTQKSLCSQMFLPKQTIHSVVRSFQKQGLLEMIEQSEDRRQRMLRLTKTGKEYAQRILLRMEQAEINSIGQFGPEERTLLLRLMERYAKTFSMELKP